MHSHAGAWERVKRDRIQSNSLKTRPQIECVHQQYKSMKAKFPISIFQFQRSVNAYFY